MATHTTRRVLNYAGAIFIVLILGGLLLASYMILDLSRGTHTHRTHISSSTTRLSQNKWALCNSKFAYSHPVLKSYLCSGLMELLPREPPQIVPPLVETGCDGKQDLDRMICKGQLLKPLIIIASASAGVVVFIIAILVGWTIIRWIITARPSYVEKKSAQFARAMEKSRRSRGIIGTEESLEEGTMRYPPPDPQATARIHKYVTFQGVRTLLPWGRGSEWSQAEVEVVRRGIMPGFMVGMMPSQIVMDITEPGELERGGIFARSSRTSTSEATGSNRATRVVSTGHEIKGLGHVEFRRRSGLSDGFPEP